MQATFPTTANVRRTWNHWLALALVLLQFPALLAAAGEPGWTAIFNGRDLTGWRIIGEPKSGWAVTDGIMHTSGPGGWL